MARSPTSNRRAGRGARLIVSARRRELARQHWRRLLVVVVGFPVAGVAIGQVQSTSFMNGLAIGVFATLGFAFVAYFFAIFGVLQQEMGAEAELWTSQALRQLGEDWTVFDDVHFADGNVDHVVVGPGRIYAVETKWTSWDGPIPDAFVDRWARQAEWAARRTRSVLRSARLDREVVPLLVVWGNKDGLPAMELRCATRVLVGAHKDVWTDRIRDAAHGQPDHEASAVLTGYVDRRQQERFTRLSRRFSQVRVGS